MKISVLTVCYNSAATIEHTLDSFFSQDWMDKELVVVDGASSDGTIDIIRSYADSSVRFISEPDAGMYDALNKALKLYQGDAFGVLNADDTYHDRFCLSRIAEVLSRADIAHGHLNFVNDHIGSRIVRRWQACNPPRSGFKSGWMPAHPTFYCRRGVGDVVGEFDTSLATASDYDWMLRAVELFDHSIELVDHVLIDMMQGGRSTNGLRTHFDHNLEALRSRRKWLGVKWVDYALFAKPLSKISQFCQNDDLSDPR